MGIRLGVLLWLTLYKWLLDVFYTKIIQENLGYVGEIGSIVVQVHIEHGVPDFDRRYVYHVAAGSQGKIHQERG